jgi:hypothetical protein
MGGAPEAFLSSSQPGQVYRALRRRAGSPRTGDRGTLPLGPSVGSWPSLRENARRDNRPISLSHSALIGRAVGREPGPRAASFLALAQDLAGWVASAPDVSQHPCHWRGYAASGHPFPHLARAGIAAAHAVSMGRPISALGRLSRVVPRDSMPRRDRQAHGAQPGVHGGGDARLAVHGRRRAARGPDPSRRSTRLDPGPLRSAPGRSQRGPSSITVYRRPRPSYAPSFPAGGAGPVRGSVGGRPLRPG